MKNLDRALVASSIAYDPETGVFTKIGIYPGDLRKTRPDVVGCEVGSVNTLGYLMVSIGPKRYLGHRVAFLLMTGAVPRYVDHIDGNPSNNAWANLRACTQSQNLANRGKTKASTSGFKGVTWCAYTNKWRAKITVRGKDLHLGRFKEASQAGEAYASACKMYFGEFGRSE
ncbi:AP2 domain protein [compost metagenome]